MADQGALDQVQQVPSGLHNRAICKSFQQQPLELLRVLAP